MARRVAVIGSGIAGLATAYTLSDPAHAAHCAVTLFEAGDYFGGHTHTVDVTLAGPQGPVTHGVDTGFLVFNHRTYPLLVRLFDELGVETAPAEMSFSVQAGGGALEWSGCDLNGVFAQRRNAVSPRFWRMLSDIVRFNRRTNALATRGDESALQQPIGEFLAQEGYSTAFREGYFLPMVACIWSCPTEQMLRFPIATMIRFCHNHGLLQISDRPTWHTVRGGARGYVQRMVGRIDDARLASPVTRVRRLPAGALVTTAASAEAFDDVVFACHSDQALALMADASAEETAVLGAIRYHPNRAVLHTDTTLLPRRRRAWAAWNYERATDPTREDAGVCLHYLLNRLQPLPFTQDVIVTLNPVREPAPETVLASFDYAHPVFDLPALAAQRSLGRLQGQRNSWFCGAWTGYGFHEDGLRSGLATAQALIERATIGMHRRAA